MKRGNCNNLEELSDRMLAQAAWAAALRAEMRLPSADRVTAAACCAETWDDLATYGEQYS